MDSIRICLSALRVLTEGRKYGKWALVDEC